MLGVARAEAPSFVVPRTAERVAPARRLASLDACRGIAVVGMLVANLVNVCLHDVPTALTHNYGNTLRAFDLPAPLFQFLVGVSLPLFLAQRRRNGRSEREAGLDAVRRFTLLIGLGILLDGAGAMSFVPRWGVLQTLGLGGIIATGFVGLPRWVMVGVIMELLAFFGRRERTRACTSRRGARLRAADARGSLRRRRARRRGWTARRRATGHMDGRDAPSCSPPGCTR